MGFLVAHILFVVGFALALRRAQTRGYDFFLMTGTNYATGLVIGVVWLAVAGAASVDLATVLLGIVQGARFSLAVVAIYLLLVRTGVGITFVLLRMAVIVPTVASILWFGERPDLPTLLGIGLMLAALPLLTRGGRSEDARLRVWWYWPVVVGTLTVTGAGLIAAKAFVESRPHREYAALRHDHVCRGHDRGARDVRRAPPDPTGAQPHGRPTRGAQASGAGSFGSRWLLGW